MAAALEVSHVSKSFPGVKALDDVSMTLTAGEKDGEVVFYHKLQAGKASKSYGIAVARLAGLPATVIERAKDVLAKLEKYELAVFADETRSGLTKAAGGRAISQVSLFAVSNETVIDDLRDVDVDKIDPNDAKALLAKLQTRII